MSVQSKKLKTTKEITVFAMLGALMFCSKLIMEFLPNIHLLGVLTATYTVVFRKKALFPIYVYVLLNGIYAGFAMWWWPYVYIWTLLWGAVMLIPKNISKNVKRVVYPAVCCIHGLLFGTLYAPFQALAMKLSFKQTVAWIVAGLPFDLIHGAGNLVLGLLIIPISDLLLKMTEDIR